MLQVIYNTKSAIRVATGVGRKRSTLNSGRTRLVPRAPRRAFGAVRDKTRKGPVRRGGRSERDGRGARSVSSNTSSPTANCTSPGRRRAPPCAGPAAPATGPELPHPRAPSGSRPPRRTPPGRVRRRGSGAAGVLAAVGVEGRVAGCCTRAV